MNKYLITIATLFTILGCYAQCLEGNCIDGYGKFACDCGYVYEGEFKNGSRTNGTLTKSDLIYVGEFQNDLAHGVGTIKYKDSSWYEGSFVENYPDGYGHYHLTVNQNYIGEIEQGFFHGLGIEKTQGKDSSNITFKIGQFDQDQLDGFGCRVDSDGNVHFGKFSNGSPEGIGLSIFCEKNELEVGEYKKKRIVKNQTLKNKTQDGGVLIEGFEIGAYTYDLVSDNYGYSIQLTVYKKGKVFRVVLFNRKEDIFYLSNEFMPEVGQVIRSNGEIWNATLVSDGSKEIILNEVKFSQRK